ncbi:MAG TPA: PPOX class F420-dependent oxidoreductase [Mycobacteriales bacterium]|nr:PPOX class F420-dependent oxidoreductase [Mycobacteriales bacterium]
MNLDDAREFIRTHHHAVLATIRRDGRPQLSPVAVGVADDGAVLISTRENAAKTRNIRRNPSVSVCVLSDGFFGEFVQVEGTATVIDLPDALDGLVEYYRGISGEHPDWEDYRAAMVRDQRVLVRIIVTRAGPDYRG